MSSSGGLASDSFASNPASALVAYSRPPIPLAPSLTTASTSPRAHHASSFMQSAEGSQSTARSSRLHRPLIYRASLSQATQALNIDASPPSARFSAYNTPRPARTRLQGSLPRSTPDHFGVAPRKSVGTFAFGLDDSSTAQKRSFEPETETVEDHFEVLRQFRRDADFPGDVLVRCAGVDFYVHRAILYFASPFFQAVLDGDWKETHPSLHSLSDCSNNDDEEELSSGEGILVESSSPSRIASREERRSIYRNATSPRASFYTADFTFDGQDDSDAQLSSIHSEKSSSVTDPERTTRDTTKRLERLATPPQHDIAANNSEDSPTLQVMETDRRLRSRKPDKKRPNVIAIIDLSEEDASIFQDFLCLVYPNLDLLVTWYNIFQLFSFSDKFEVPNLRRACITFLRAALAGRPIEAMALSERHGLEDVYREASRHVLENMPSWEPEELEILSSETLLKLERKRTWFLERLLKLGLANPIRDYECHAACPDPPNCARLLHERWRSQYANAFKFGPPQPSIIWRHLRELEINASSTTNAPPMSACQSSSKAWVQLLFDRMYGLPTHGMTHPKFLSIKLDSDHTTFRCKRRPTTTEGDLSLTN